MPVTLKDVAERAQVSRSAVSRTFTEGASVSDKMRKKVEKAARELGYTPNIIARSLATNRTKLIGLVSNNFHNPTFMQVFDLFTGALQERDLRPLLVNLSDRNDPQECVRMLHQYRVDGVVVASSTLPPSFPLAFKRARIPVVHAFGRIDSPSQVHVVGIDNRHGGTLAARALLARGYQRIAFLGGPEAASSTQDRLSGFVAALREAQLPLAGACYAAEYAYEPGRLAMEELLATHEVDAVFCGDDVICIGAMDATRDAGLSIPDDIGFVGFNNMEMAAWRAFRLTTVNQPIRDIIASAVELIVALLDDPERAPEVRLLPCSMVERDTLRACAGVEPSAQVP